MNIYADSSFLVSLYVRDVHSPEASQRMQRRPVVLITQLNRSELAHLLSQYVFRAIFSDAEAKRYWSEFEDDCQRTVWHFNDFPEATWQRSIDLARRFGPTIGIRTLDSLHVACALEMNARRFWTFDERQLKLAEAAGLNTAP